MSEPFLDARLEAAKLRTLYANDPRQQSFRVLVTGDSGTGKTHLLRTARLPVHIDSFDPGGTLVLRDLVDKGDVVADVVYELEDRTAPSMFREWCRTFEQRVRSKYFDSISTYALDSSTLWADAIMNYIQQKAENADTGHKTKLVGQAPRWAHDYVPQKAEIQNWMRRILALPCDVVVTGHLEGDYNKIVINRGTRDEEVISELIKYKYMTTGKGATYIPLMFDEQWTTFVEEKGSGREYKVLTAQWKLYRARTRIGRGTFATFEAPNIKGLLKKAGWSTSDKPKLY